MAGRFRVPGLRPSWGVAAGGRQAQVFGVRAPYLGDRGHDLRPDANAADSLVHCLLAVRDRERWDFGTQI